MCYTHGRRKVSSAKSVITVFGESPGILAISKFYMTRIIKCFGCSQHIFFLVNKFNGSLTIPHSALFDNTVIYSSLGWWWTGQAKHMLQFLLPKNRRGDILTCRGTSAQIHNTSVLTARYIITCTLRASSQLPTSPLLPQLSFVSHLIGSFHTLRTMNSGSLL